MNKNLTTTAAASDPANPFAQKLTYAETNFRLAQSEYRRLSMEFNIAERKACAHVDEAAKLRDLRDQNLTAMRFWEGCAEQVRAEYEVAALADDGILTIELDAEGRTEHMLHDPKTRTRFHIGGVKAGDEGRKESGEKLVPGPWAFIHEACVVISTSGGTWAERQAKLARNLEHDVKAGDMIRVDGVLYYVYENRGDRNRLGLTEAE